MTTVIFLILAVWALYWQGLFFAPLFLFVYLYVTRQNVLLVFLLVVLSLAGDAIWVYQLGFSGLLFSLMLSAISLYSHRYNLLNFSFITGLLIVGTLFMYYFSRPGFSWWQIPIYGGMLWLLFRQTRELYKENIKSLY